MTLITPSPGFVIKTATVAPGHYQSTIQVPAHCKTFINVLFHAAIPQPPAARLGAEEEERILNQTLNGDPHSIYFVPFVVNDGVAAKDKAGNPSIVFDAILHPSLKPRLTKNINFKSFVLELILSEIESPPSKATRSLSLSRTLATPNIRYKGTLQAREVQLPDVPDVGAGAGEGRGASATGVTPPKKPLIEELPETHPKPQELKSILKKPTIGVAATAQPGILPPQNLDDPHAVTDKDKTLETPIWHWDPDTDPTTGRLVINVPKFTHTHHPHTHLYLSPDMLTLRTPVYFLHIPLPPPHEHSNTVTSTQELDVLNARSEWRVAEGRLIVFCYWKRRAESDI